MTHDQQVAIATLETQIEHLEKKLDAFDKRHNAAGDVITYMGKRFRVASIRKGDDPNSFERRCQEIKKRDGVSLLTAMSTARKEFPSDFAKYQDRMSLPLTPTTDRLDLPARSRLGDDAGQEFENLISQIMTTRGVSRVNALVLARKENPAAFASYQQAAE